MLKILEQNKILPDCYHFMVQSPVLRIAYTEAGAPYDLNLFKIASYRFGYALNNVGILLCIL